MKPRTVQESKKSPRQKDTKKSIVPEREIKRIQWLNEVKKSHNEPLYVFIDNADYKFVVFNLQHVGNVMPKEIIKKKKEIKILCQKEVCKRGLCIKECSCQESSITSVSSAIEESSRMIGCAIIEHYDWKQRSFGDTVVCLTTYGTQSVIIDFEPGR